MHTGSKCTDFSIFSTKVCEKEREIMRKRLSQNCGIVHFDLNVLLDARKEDEFKDWRSAILTELETLEMISLP